jgi:hypothetical protein
MDLKIPERIDGKVIFVDFMEKFTEWAISGLRDYYPISEIFQGHLF